MEIRLFHTHVGATPRAQNNCSRKSAFPHIRGVLLIEEPIGKYGNLRLAFIKEHRKGTYTTLLTQFKLNEYLHMIDIEAAEQVRMITSQLADSRGINEELKFADMLRWVAEMNAAKHDAEEIVLREIIYS